MEVVVSSASNPESEILNDVYLEQQDARKLKSLKDSKLKFRFLDESAIDSKFNGEILIIEDVANNFLGYIDLLYKKYAKEIQKIVICTKPSSTIRYLDNPFISVPKLTIMDFELNAIPSNSNESIGKTLELYQFMKEKFSLEKLKLVAISNFISKNQNRLSSSSKTPIVKEFIQVLRDDEHAVIPRFEEMNEGLLKRAIDEIIDSHRYLSADKIVVLLDLIEKSCERFYDSNKDNPSILYSELVYFNDDEYDGKMPDQSFFEKILYKERKLFREQLSFPKNIEKWKISRKLIDEFQ